MECLLDRVRSLATTWYHHDLITTSVDKRLKPMLLLELRERLGDRLWIQGIETLTSAGPSRHAPVSVDSLPGGTDFWSVEIALEPRT